MKILLDIETDSLYPSVIHLAVAKQLNTNTYVSFGGPNGRPMSELPAYLNQAEKIIMHNGLSFDLPSINRLLNCNISYSKVIDTLLLSQLHNPIIDRGHSLGEWGERFGLMKMDFNDWSNYSPMMEEYCKRDVDITEKLYNHFVKHASDFSKRSVDLEHAVRRAINIQEDTGFYLDIQAATLLLCDLSDESFLIEKKMQETFEPTILPRKRIPDKVVPFNPQSRQQIADRLVKRGWKPTEFTEKTGNPIVNEKTLSQCPLPEAKQLVRYMLLKKRESQIKSWMKVVNPDTNRVHGKVITIGAVTNRMTHNSPNMAQIPAVYSPYGKECRSCWTVEDSENYRLVGADSSGLELRCLAHYIQDDDYTREILEGDVHTANQKAAGLDNRDQAKTFIYAFLYGAGAAKIGQVVGGSSSEGQVLINRFLDRMPKLSRWRNQIIEEATSSEKVKAIDGRYLHVRSSHSSVNTLLQGMGAIVCKDWLTQIMSLVKTKGLDAKPVANVHDEVQFEVHKEDAKEFSSLTRQATKQTEENLSVKCPLDSESKIGLNWSETH